MALLLDPDFLRTLERLRLLVHGRYRGRLSGQRTTSRAGMSLEFAEYKEYQPGDDLRYVDWNLYGRLGKLFIKVFNREEDVPVYLFLDVSRSMAADAKFATAQKLCAALAYVALKELNRVGVVPFAGDIRQGVPPRGGQRQIVNVFQFLQDLEPAGQTSINTSLAQFARARRESGLAIVASDMLSEGGYEEGLMRLVYHGYEVVLLHVLSPEERDPTFGGELRLRDAETDAELALNVDEPTRVAYRERVASFLEELEAFCRERGMRYVALSTSMPLDALILDALREGSVIA